MLSTEDSTVIKSSWEFVKQTNIVKKNHLQFYKCISKCKGIFGIDDRMTIIKTLLCIIDKRLCVLYRMYRFQFDFIQTAKKSTQLLPNHEYQT